MIDLNPILVELRNYFLSESTGLPDALKETKDKPMLIAALQKIVEGAPLSSCAHVEDLDFLIRFFEHKNDPMKLFFGQLLILKFLYEKTLEDNSLIEDKQWFSDMRDKLNRDFSTVKQSLYISFYDKKIQINSLKDLEPIQAKARSLILEGQIMRPLIFLAIAFGIYLAVTRRTITSILIPFVFLAGYRGFQASSERGRNMLFDANNATRRLQDPQPQANNSIMEHDAIKKFFILNDDELDQLTRINHSPRPSQ